MHLSSIYGGRMGPATENATRRPRRRTLITVLAAIGAVIAVVLAAVLWAAHTYGPRYGFYLIPPSPQKYSEMALDHLEQGYYATGPEWEAAREDLARAGAEADDYADLHDEIAAATAVAGGKHSRFLTPEETEQYESSSTDEFEAPTVTTENGITTITVPKLGSVSEELQQQYAQTAADGIAAATPGTCGWVIDLRGNTGGNMYPMLSGLAAMLPNGDAFSFATRDGTSSSVTVQDDGVGMGDTITSVGDQPKITGAPIAVLQDELTASSGEAVATAFRGLDQARSFGTPSAGYTSGNVMPRLYDGATIVLTGSVYVDRDGVSLDEEPIEPDQSVEAADADDAAAQWLGEQGCGN